MAKSPAFQFYPSDWLSSTHVALMSSAQEGAYIRLLCHAWADPDCSLPDDDNKLAVLSRLGEGWLKGGSHLVRQCFVPHPHKEGRIVNERLLQEREKQRIWREKSRAGGVRSGHTRSKNPSNTTKGGSVLVEPNANQMATLQSSSSSSSSNKKGKYDPLAFAFPMPLSEHSGFVIAWSDFVKHRAGMGKPLTANACGLLSKKFAAWGAPISVAAIHASIEGGYQGVFAPKNAPVQQFPTPQPAKPHEWQ